MITRIISGAQTGADRGGLDAAIFLGIPHGGYCPRDRKAEDGRIPDVYQVEETLQPTYPPRTALNIRYSDATLIFNLSKQMERGSALTVELCIEMHKPFLLIWYKDGTAEDIKDFIKDNKVKTLNVAGNRESKSPGIQKFVKEVLIEALAQQNG